MGDYQSFYVLRYLPPKTFGNGEIALTFSTEGEPTLELIQGQYPDAFAKPGFYTLMKGTGQCLDLTPTPNRALR